MQNFSNWKHMMKIVLPEDDNKIKLRTTNSIDKNIMDRLTKKPEMAVSTIRNLLFQQHLNTYNLSIIKKDTNKFIGLIILEEDIKNKTDDNVSIFINYWIEMNNRNNRFATKAVKLTCDIVKKLNINFNANIKDIKAFVIDKNIYSIKVLKNSGFDEFPDNIYADVGKLFIKNLSTD
ncbi:MAG: GNAT family N-acetyltransferase [Candidatus Marsarchaeota archaeon]|jgi:RimJ/RimL family protein N-acetyltransferase|nr:GNAT family N-acetyltransferase [Candidatus Marsarchaeota archaeon]